MVKIDSNLFSAPQGALEHAERCPECGASLVLRGSSSGPFWGCENYPKCEYSRPTHAHEHRIERELDMPCPECSKPLALKQGRYGFFIGCTGFPDCHYHTQLESPDDTGIPCPKCKTGELIQRNNRYGKTFYACNGYPKCQFAVNHPPQKGTCEFCGFELLVERKLASGRQLQCANKKCGKKQSMPK
ncbi:topoisomerase DNA-binding C4 zinc finger domain-containing protein [Corallincola platygyrae]|uniref:Topoisomerase DNA-binding C4 zinc finger domain-containing protein n=1 Tax=Corallincola platygyrae TaxID=1193278 RepID=A0ABW4XPI2_9GAMM